MKVKVLITKYFEKEAIHWALDLLSKAKINFFERKYKKKKFDANFSIRPNAHKLSIRGIKNIVDAQSL